MRALARAAIAIGLCEPARTRPACHAIRAGGDDHASGQPARCAVSDRSAQGPPPSFDFPLGERRPRGSIAQKVL